MKDLIEELESLSNAIEAGGMVEVPEGFGDATERLLRALRTIHGDDVAVAGRLEELEGRVAWLEGWAAKVMTGEITLGTWEDIPPELEAELLKWSEEEGERPTLPPELEKQIANYAKSVAEEYGRKVGEEEE